MLKKFSEQALEVGKNLNLRKHAAPISLMLLSVGMFFYVFAVDSPIETNDPQAAAYRSQAKQMSALIAEKTLPIKRRLEEIATQPGLVDTLKQFSSTLLTQEDKQLPGLLALRLLRASATDTLDDEAPNLSYACFDMVFEAVKAKADKPFNPVEVHLFGNDSQHVDYVQVVRNSNGVAEGALLASFNVGVLPRYLSGLQDINGDLELQQIRQVLASTGAKGERALKAYRAPVPGTRWFVSYWPATDKTKQIIDFADTQFLIVSGFASVILLLSLGLFGRTWLANRNRENKEIMSSVPETVIRQVDESVTDASSEDLLFQSSDNLVVEEEETEAEIETEREVVEDSDPKGIASIFKAYDIRGVVGKTLTEEVVYEIGQALGSEAQARQQTTMVVGRDGRNSGPTLISKLISGLRVSGIDVIDVGLVPTPLLYFASNTVGSCTGVMLTGSHNPPDYNGLKMVIDGVTLARDDIQIIRKRVEQNDFLSGKGKLREVPVISGYMKRVTSDVMLTKRFKVVVDCGNGAAGVIAPSLLTALGCDVVELFCDVDGNFPNHHPDPSRPENLKDLIAAVKEHKADLGIAFDGDGDRLGVITNEGDVIWPDRVMMLYAMDVLSRNPGGEIIFDVKCSTKLKQVIEQHGGKATMWNTGHSLIKAKMRETGALLAGEMSGHIFFKERWYGFDDGLYSAARLIEILCTMTADKTVADVFRSLPDSVNTPEINVAMEEGTQHSFMKRLLAKAKFDDGEMTTIDGLRVDFPDGWGLVRASNTTPVLVLRFEADTDVALERIMVRFRQLMMATDPNIKLSF